MSHRSGRRTSPRYKVTLSARVSDATTLYRSEILDVSLGGLLLSRPEAFSAEAGPRLVIDAAMIGTIQARVVTTSARGIQLRVDRHGDEYRSLVRRVSKVSRSWTA